MNVEHLKLMETLGAQGKAFGEFWERYFTAAFLMHGHLCGGMPLGFRAGVAALKALGREREADMGQIALVETGLGHAAGCFADGVQLSTGCTFGKGLIRRTDYGKWAATVVDKATRRAARVSVRPEVMEASFQSPFIQLRRAGTPPSQVPLEVSRPLVENLLAQSDEALFSIARLEQYPVPASPPSTFETVRCSVCDELVAENKIRFKHGQPVCAPCSGYDG
jgi:formylmethanofuran dehydrogenase subunit E